MCTKDYIKERIEFWENAKEIGMVSNTMLRSYMTIELKQILERMGQNKDKNTSCGSCSICSEESG